jgi:hypothetical protein
VDIELPFLLDADPFREDADSYEWPSQRVSDRRIYLADTVVHRDEPRNACDVLGQPRSGVNAASSPTIDLFLDQWERTKRVSR